MESHCGDASWEIPIKDIPDQASLLRGPLCEQ